MTDAEKQSFIAAAGQSMSLRSKDLDLKILRSNFFTNYFYFIYFFFMFLAISMTTFMDTISLTLWLSCAYLNIYHLI